MKRSFFVQPFVCFFVFLVLEATVTEFTSRPPNKLSVLEGQDIILVWSYTLDGGVGLAKFTNVTGGVRDEIGKTFTTGNVPLGSNYQARFRAEVSNTQARLRILAIQITDQGKYEFDITASAVGGGDIIHVVEVIVQCTYFHTSRKVVSIPSFLLPFRIVVGILQTPKRSYRVQQNYKGHCVSSVSYEKFNSSHGVPFLHGLFSKLIVPYLPSALIRKFSQLSR